MRCKNCGWENPSGATSCQKCSSPLEVASPVVKIPDAGAELSKTIVSHHEPLASLSATVKSQGNLKSKTAKSTSSCPACKYPLRPGITTCPKCGYALSEKPSTTINKTVDPWSSHRIPVFSLKMLPRENEQTESAIAFEGESVILKRENTDPANKTITSADQALLERIDGNWYLTDRSPLQNTFVRPSVPFQLKDGDIILLGDRKFEFKVNA